MRKYERCSTCSSEPWCRVVHGGDVPDEVRPGPEREGDHGVGEQPRPAERSRQADHAERRSPLGEDDVLEQVDRQQIVERDRVQRRDEDREDQAEPGYEAGDSPVLRPVAPDEERVADGERRDEEKRLEVERPGVGIVHGSGRYAMGLRVRGVVVTREPSKL